MITNTIWYDLNYNLWLNVFNNSVLEVRDKVWRKVSAGRYFETYEIRSKILEQVRALK